MISFLQILFCIGISWGGFSGKMKLTSYTIYSFDDNKVLLVSNESKKKWSMPRSSWFGGQQPTIGKKVRISDSLQKQLVPYQR